MSHRNIANSDDNYIRAEEAGSRKSKYTLGESICGAIIGLAIFAGVVYALVEWREENSRPEHWDPSEPGDHRLPIIPDDPAKPEDPEQPEDPVEPLEPVEPKSPDEPVEPARPDDPEEPDQPVEPTLPDDPEEPEQPDTPAEPSEPSDPTDPVEPTKPDEPVTPEEPDVPTPVEPEPREPVEPIDPQPKPSESATHCSLPVPALPARVDQTAVPQFAAGYLYGISKHVIDKRDYILSCYQQDDELTAFLYASIASYNRGATSDGDAQLACAKAYFSSMRGCDITNPMFLDAEEYFEDFDEREDASEIRAENYQTNKATIDRDRPLITREWNNGVYFNAGFFSAESQGLYEGYPTIAN